MDATLALTGLLPFIVLVAGALTAVTSAVLLAFYRRATLRGMNRTARPGSSVPLPPATSGSRVTTARKPLRVHEVRGSGAAELSPAAARSLRAAERSQLAGTAVHLLGGLAYSLVMAAAWIAIADDGVPLGRLLWLIVLFLWPAVIVSTISLAINGREALAVSALYLILLCLVASLVLWRNPALSAAGLIVNWTIINLPASVLFLAFLQKRIRAVGPLVFAFMLAGVAGASLLLQLIGTNDAALGAIVSLGAAIGLDATALFVLLHALGFAALASLGWLGLRRIGIAYRDKRLGDQSIIIDSAWLVFAVAQSIGLAFEGAYWILSGPLAFVACRTVTALGLSRLADRAARQAADGPAPRSLLLLRVFSLGRRSERFFDGFSKLWRRIGSTSMIAGPDLVTTAVEPHEFLDFVGGRLSRRFVKGEDDLRRRLEQIDRRPDPDARFRVHEFFCHDDTWRMTMQSLAHGSESVLMDLRSFSETNRGCLFELEVLIDTVDLRRVVCLVDRTTDRAFLERSFRALWDELNADSPNATLSDPVITLCHVDRRTRRMLRLLIGRLLDG